MKKTLLRTVALAAIALSCVAVAPLATASTPLNKDPNFMRAYLEGPSRPAKVLEAKIMIPNLWIDQASSKKPGQLFVQGGGYVVGAGDSVINGHNLSG